MPYILKNKNLELHFDAPHEGYQATRFDWTGKIVSLRYKNQMITHTEKRDQGPNEPLGKGFYNEFGIDSPLGFEEAPIGGWFHKIGVGLLKKEEETYVFHKKYDLKPARFTLTGTTKSIQIGCIADNVNGYSYELEKVIRLMDNGFKIGYHLKNTGKKPIITQEYNHNFLALDPKGMPSDNQLLLPFYLLPETFGETVNPENKVTIMAKGITFRQEPHAPFFFSNLSGGKTVNAAWKMELRQSQLAISERGSFKTDKINLWGDGHVISPELFFNIHLAPHKALDWSRHYTLVQTN